MCSTARPCRAGGAASTTATPLPVSAVVQDNVDGVVLHSALCLFTSLAAVLNRDGVSSVVSSHYFRLVAVAVSEVQAVLSLFLAQCANPPPFLHYPVFAGRAAWAHALHRRLDDAVVPVSRRTHIVTRSRIYTKTLATRTRTPTPKRTKHACTSVPDIAPVLL